MTHANPVFAQLPTTIFTVMSALAVEHGAVNLGQGFPDKDGPNSILAAAARALTEESNQYPPMRGRQDLRRALAAHAMRFYGLSYDADTEIVVTSGATEALTAAILAFAPQGGEVVLIDPSYDSYSPIAEAAGARVKTLSLAPPDWRLTEEALRSVITPSTSALLLNSPMNPIGKVFDDEELATLARVLSETNAIAILDEVYEHLVFDDRAHRSLASLPGMRERCVRIGSAGKMFSLTGWKVGWVMGPAPLIDVAAKAHQFLTFTTPPALQKGIAFALEHEMDFTLNLTRDLQDRRDLLAQGLARLGFKPLACEGTYFLTADIRGLIDESDAAFCQRLVREAGVAAIPLSAFFQSGKPDHLIRFAFCKQQSVLEEAVKRLERYFKRG
ncbi:aspartate/methionine/tyrosine aminotransferase [Rhizomicrobium palustre]|uniref:aspartate transaminase n=1 Tax=Rhizomicrobium palustre TaxID=189966 RepID=A0A846MXM0_9PROT|nr:aspartate/methionine/tyrosine aminotransferase [Rhizomicrobium palustre]